jgi:hypothetical protein
MHEREAAGGTERLASATALMVHVLKYYLPLANLRWHVCTSRRAPRAQSHGKQSPDTPPVILVKLVLFYLAGEKPRHERRPAACVGSECVSHILHVLYEMVTAARPWWELPGPVLEKAQEITLPRRDG